MTSTPLWVPLVVAALGVVGTLVGTLGGVVLTQRRADRREELAWARQQDRERESWAREDEARTFEHRRQAYSDFYESLKAMALRAYDHGMGLSDDGPPLDGRLPEGWQTATFRRLQQVEVYGTPRVAHLAGAAYSAVWFWGHATSYGKDDEAFYVAQDAVDAAEAELLAAIRTNLSIPSE